MSMLKYYNVRELFHFSAYFKINLFSGCKAGFTSSNGECVDVDECKNGNICGENQICINTVGSWQCCLPGFELAEDSITCVDINECVGILSWFMPRYSILVDNCRALLNYRVSNDFTKCEECPPGQGPSEDFRVCKPCHELVGHRNSTSHQFCQKCPAGQWPDETYTECKPCNELNGVRFSDDKVRSSRVLLLSDIVVA